MMAHIKYFEGLVQLQKALCKACGVEADCVQRLTLTVDFNGDLPTLEVEQLITNSERLEELADLLDKSEDVAVLQHCGTMQQTGYQLTERCGDYWRRATFKTYDELCEHLKHRREPDADHTESPG